MTDIQIPPDDLDAPKTREWEDTTAGYHADYFGMGKVAYELMLKADAAIAELLADLQTLKDEKWSAIEALQAVAYLQRLLCEATWPDSLIQKEEYQARAEQAEAALARVHQCHSYRLPVVALDVGTQKVGVHWVDGFDRAEVIEAMLRNPSEWTPYESVEWKGDPEAALAERNRMLRLAAEDFASLAESESYEHGGSYKADITEYLADLRTRAEEGSE